MTNKTDPLTTDEIEKIAKVVEDGVRSGALGFSTSRTLLHRDRTGILVPGTLATEEELLKIGWVAVISLPLAYKDSLTR